MRNLGLILCLFWVVEASGQVVEIPAPNLRAVIAEALGKPAAVPITVEEIETLTELLADALEISDLTGLEHATNLESVSLEENPIADTAPLCLLKEKNPPLELDIPLACDP